MARKFNAQIIYTMKPSHPDYDHLQTKNWFRDRFLTYEDTYEFGSFYDLWPNEELVEHMKRDLKLIASGGYNTDHIENVSFLIKEVS